MPKLAAVERWIAAHDAKCAEMDALDKRRLAEIETLQSALYGAQASKPEPGACCRAAVEALEKIAEHAGSHTIKADDPARSYYGWGYVYDLASAALSAVSGAK